MLLPELKQGQFVIIDNAAFHKSERTKELIESVGCKLVFLPPYSPGLNPIEPQWNAVKQGVRSNNDPNLNFYDKLDLQIVAMSR
jgi:transposase